jgi:hypothetical protein
MQRKSGIMKYTIALALALSIAILAIRPAPAAVDVELPDETLGAWCGQYSYQFPDLDYPEIGLYRAAIRDRGFSNLVHARRS